MIFIFEDNTISKFPPDPYKGERVKAVIVTSPEDSVCKAYLAESFRWCGVKETPNYQETLDALREALDKQLG